MKLYNCNSIRGNDDWTVWRGQTAGDGQMYLVKEARKDSPYRPILLTRLADEYQFLDRFHHPVLLRPVELDAAAGRAVYADAQCNLTQDLEAHGPIPPTLVANVLAMAADGLDHLHGRGVLARGIPTPASSPRHWAVDLESGRTEPVGPIMSTLRHSATSSPTDPAAEDCRGQHPAPRQVPPVRRLPRVRPGQRPRRRSRRGGRPSSSARQPTSRNRRWAASPMPLAGWLRQPS